MKNIKAIIRDIFKLSIFGILSAVGIVLILFFAGAVGGNSGIDSGIEIAKNGVLLFSSLILFILAGMLVTKGKKTGEESRQEGWRRHFKVIGYKTAVGVVGISFVIIANVVDCIQRYLR